MKQLILNRTFFFSLGGLKKTLPALKSDAGAWGIEERMPDVTMVGTALVMELGGASMPAGCSGGRGGGGPAAHTNKQLF